MNWPGERLATLGSDRSGNVSMLLAAALTMLIATAALAIDAGTLFLEKRRLQGIADAAALAAASDPATANASAQAAIDVNRHDDVTLRGAQSGGYVADAALAAADRFQPGSTPANAVRVMLDGNVPSFFSRAFTGAGSTRISARATAARIDLAAFSIGSRLVAVQGGLPNALLSGLAGTELGLSVSDYNALIAGRVDILKFSEALRTILSLDAGTFGEALKSKITLPQAATALATATRDAGAASVLRAIAAKLPPTLITAADVIDLGPLGNSVSVDETRPVDVDAFSVLRAMLEIGSPTRQVAANVSLGIPGIASTRIVIQIGERPAHSPWLAVSALRKITIRTAQTRLSIDATLVGTAGGLGTIRVPFFVELASAEATLAAVSCAQGRANASATLDVTPSVGSVAIADFDMAAFADFTTPLALRPALLAKVPLISVTGFADVRLGGTHAQAVTFSAADIAAHRVQTVSTNDIVQGVATSLLRQTELRATVAGLGLGAGAATAAVGGVLDAAAPALDSLVESVTGLAGVRVGQADVWVNGVRCGTPVLVS